MTTDDESVRMYGVHLDGTPAAHSPTVVHFTHALKIWPEYFEPTVWGRKPFEIRRNDRTPRFEQGQVLLLREWHPGLGEYTGQSVRVLVLDVWDLAPLGFPGFVAMSTRKLAGSP